MGYNDLARAYAADISMHDLAMAMAPELDLEAELVLLPGACIVGETFWHMAHPEDLRWDDLSEANVEQVEQQIPALRDVIRRYYVMLDGLLGDLLELAGADATVAVVSDHGIEGWVYGPEGNPLLGPNMHDETGFWIMSGPRVREGVRLHDLELLDFAPTLADAAGLDLGHEPEGRVRRDALID
jgi:predicted AlkP superfamily phosphohydrolase/phosphomutase